MFGHMRDILTNPIQWLQWKYEVLGSSRCCYMCGRRMHRFAPYRGGTREVPMILRDLKSAGSDFDNFECPHCGCHDRERHLKMYFDRLELWSHVTDRAVLHIAPEEQFPQWVEKAGPRLYIKGDLHPKCDDIHEVDITQITFSDCHFDLVLCNHVLEHVPEDQKAMNEFFRVLKPGGIAILQTPYSTILRNTFCDDGIDSDELRSRIYGEWDHVRIYGLDFFERIENAGFEVQRVSHEDALGDIDPMVYGVNPCEDLVLCRKAQAPSS